MSIIIYDNSNNNKAYKPSITINLMVYVDKKVNQKYQREYQREWRANNKERVMEINKKSEQREERKEYRRNWWKTNPKAKLIKERFKENNPNIQKKYDKEFKERHPDRVRKKDAKYYSSLKGIVNRLKKSDRKKFNIENKEITIDLIKELDIKFTFCMYCGEEFKPRFDYDHINPFKPFSKNNIIKVCSKCNQSKNNANLLEWMNFKKFTISDKIMELYSLSL